MTDIFISPDMPITINDTEYTMRGSLEVLKSIQNRMGEPIDRVAQKWDGLGFDELAGIIYSAISKPKELSIDAISQWILDEYGIGEAKLLIMEFLFVAIVPKRQREVSRKKCRDLQKNIMEMMELQGST